MKRAAPVFFWLDAMAYTEEEVAIFEQAALDALAQPERVRSADGEEILERPISDILKAASHVASQASSSGPQFGLRFAQIVPPGGGGTP